MSELLLRLQLVLDVGRDLDEVLLSDPLPVPDEDHTTIGLRTSNISIVLRFERLLLLRATCRCFDIIPLDVSHP